MNEFPSWFGVTEFYVVVATVWMFLICWVATHLIRVGGVKWDVKKYVVKLKSWWSRKRGRVYDDFEQYGFKEFIE